MIDPKSLEVGKIYRSRRPQALYDTVAGVKVWDHRTIIRADETHVIYDSVSVPRGTNLPRVTREKFARWAAEEVIFKEGAE